MEQGKGTRGSNPCAGQHWAIVFAIPRLTITSFKSNKAKEEIYVLFWVAATVSKRAKATIKTAMATPETARVLWG